MPSYRKKPVVIEAMELTRNFHAQVFDFIGADNIANYGTGEFAEDDCYIEIKTLEGTMTANEGDYVIKGVKGEFYPCKPDIFAATYDRMYDVGGD